MTSTPHQNSIITGTPPPGYYWDTTGTPLGHPEHHRDTTPGQHPHHRDTTPGHNINLTYKCHQSNIKVTSNGLLSELYHVPMVSQWYPGGDAPVVMLFGCSFDIVFVFNRCFVVLL